MFVLGVSLVGGYGAAVDRRGLVWLAAVPLLALTVLGILPIGMFVAPAALLFLIAGILLDDPHGAETE